MDCFWKDQLPIHAVLNPRFCGGKLHGQILKTVLKQSQFCLFVGGISVTNSGRKNMKGHGYIGRVSVTNSGRKSTSKPAELYCRATGEKIRKGSSKQAESYWEQREKKQQKAREKRRNHSEEQRNRERLLSSCRDLLLCEMTASA